MRNVALVLWVVLERGRLPVLRSEQGRARYKGQGVACVALGPVPNVVLVLWVVLERGRQTADATEARQFLCSVGL